MILSPLWRRFTQAGTCLFILDLSIAFTKASSGVNLTGFTMPDKEVMKLFKKGPPGRSGLQKLASCAKTNPIHTMSSKGDLGCIGHFSNHVDFPIVTDGIPIAGKQFFKRAGSLEKTMRVTSDP